MSFGKVWRNFKNLKAFFWNVEPWQWSRVQVTSAVKLNDIEFNFIDQMESQM